MTTAGAAAMSEPAGGRRSAPAPALGAVIRNSAIMKDGGFRVLEGLIDRPTRKELLAEALRLLPRAVASVVPASDDEEVRGGTPARSFLNTAGGELQDALYRTPQLLECLRQVTCSSLVPTGRLGTYSYYVRPGDFLALHRDIVTCDVAVITCLHDTGTGRGCDGGKLCLYPGRLFEPLSAIRRTLQEGALKLRLLPGQTIVMFGGIVPHALLPVDAGQARIVSVLCYRVEQSEIL
jgi:hypothetical protein